MVTCVTCDPAAADARGWDAPVASRYSCRAFSPDATFLLRMGSVCFYWWFPTVFSLHIYVPSERYRQTPHDY